LRNILMSAIFIKILNFIIIHFRITSVFNVLMLLFSQVLCEIQVAIEERSVTRRPDVTRDVMTSDFRTMTDMTSRDLRDWLIFREYMNGLEYVIQVFSHLRLRL